MILESSNGTSSEMISNKWLTAECGLRWLAHSVAHLLHFTTTTRADVYYQLRRQLKLIFNHPVCCVIWQKGTSPVWCSIKLSLLCSVMDRNCSVMEDVTARSHFSELVRYVFCFCFSSLVRRLEVSLDSNNECVVCFVLFKHVFYICGDLGSILCFDLFVFDSNRKLMEKSIG